MGRTPTPRQADALRVVRAAGRVRIRDLAAALGVAHQSADRLVDRLVLAGLAHRESSSTSRRRDTYAVVGPACPQCGELRARAGECLTLLRSVGVAYADRARVNVLVAELEAALGVERMAG